MMNWDACYMYDTYLGVGFVSQSSGYWTGHWKGIYSRFLIFHSSYLIAHASDSADCKLGHNTLDVPCLDYDLPKKITGWRSN